MKRLTFRQNASNPLGGHPCCWEFQIRPYILRLPWHIPLSLLLAKRYPTALHNTHITYSMSLQQPRKQIKGTLNVEGLSSSETAKRLSATQYKNRKEDRWINQHRENPETFKLFGVSAFFNSLILSFLANINP
jgi:hypothetical protein